MSFSPILLAVGAAASAATHAAEDDYPTPDDKEEDGQQAVLQVDIANTVLVIVAPMIVTATHKPTLLTIPTGAPRAPPVISGSVRAELALIPGP